MKIEHLDTEFKRVQPAVIALFKDLDFLKKILDDLKMANFKNKDISILTVKKKDLDKNILKGVETGLVVGVTEGGIFGWLVGLGVIAVPSAGAFIAAGPLVSAVAGAAIGANIGSIAGALIGFGIAEIEAKELEKYIKEKGVIVAVHLDDPKEQVKAKDILLSNNAIKVFNPLEGLQESAPASVNQESDAREPTSSNSEYYNLSGELPGKKTEIFSSRRIPWRIIIFTTIFILMCMWVGWNLELIKSSYYSS